MDVFGSSGVRGRVPTDFAPADAVAVAQATGRVLGADRAAVARDTRTTGPLFADAVASGLASVGTDIDRLGVVPTPGLQAYCERHGTPGVMITASHNPPEYNGLKLVGADGVGLERDRLEAVEALLDEPTPAPWDAAGRTRHVDGAAADYRTGVLAAADRDRVAAADLTVAVDPGHGAGAHTSPTLFRELGCRVLTVNAQPDGRFPGRNPEPVADNLAALGRLVRTTEADLGVAHDGDADRAVFVDETGAVVPGESSLAALAAAELDAGDVAVSAVNASGRLVDAVAAAGADLHLTAIGSTNLITAIRELRADGASVPVAGEGNGGVMFPDYRLARDGAYTAVRFLELIVDRPASDIAADYDDYHAVRESVPYDDAEERERLLRAIEETARGADAAVDDTDGYRLDYEDGWVLARPSGTEPLVRVYAEVRDPGRARALADHLLDALAGSR